MGFFLVKNKANNFFFNFKINSSIAGVFTPTMRKNNERSFNHQSLKRLNKFRFFLQFFIVQVNYKQCAFLNLRFQDD